MEGLLLNGMPDKWLEVIERDGSVIGSSATFGHFVVRPATTQDWIVSIVADLDSRGLAWQLQTERIGGPIFHAVIPCTGWFVQIDALEGVQPVLKVRKNGEEASIGGNPVVAILHQRLLKRFGLPVRSYIAPEIATAINQDEVLFKAAQIALTNFRP